jgi:hypothetical protein
LNSFDINKNPENFIMPALLKRNLPGDKQGAKILLEKVVQNNLDGKDGIDKWIGKWQLYYITIKTIIYEMGKI